MTLFKIKLTPIEKNRDWEIKHLFSSRKPKTCAHCGKPIGPSVLNTSFTKITSVGTRKSFETHYTHGHDGTSCTEGLKVKLGII